MVVVVVVDRYADSDDIYHIRILYIVWDLNPLHKASPF